MKKSWKFVFVPWLAPHYIQFAPAVADEFGAAAAADDDSAAAVTALATVNFNNFLRISWLMLIIFIFSPAQWWQIVTFITFLSCISSLLWSSSALSYVSGKECLLLVLFCDCRSRDVTHAFPTPRCVFSLLIWYIITYYFCHPCAHLVAQEEYTRSIEEASLASWLQWESIRKLCIATNGKYCCFK